MLKTSLDHFQEWLTDWNEDKTRQALYVVLAVLCGLFLGLFVDTIFHRLGNFIFPPPPLLDMADTAQLRALYATMPLESHLMRVLAWGVGGFAGAYAAVRVAKMGQYPGWLVGILLLASYLVGLIGLPVPTWVLVLCPIIVGLSAFGGAWVGMYINIRKDLQAQQA